jgi:hypothetical protein
VLFYRDCRALNRIQIAQEVLIFFAVLTPRWNRIERKDFPSCERKLLGFDLAAAAAAAAAMC